jgi:lipopolysaccharide O-acetyltransferase
MTVTMERRAAATPGYEVVDVRSTRGSAAKRIALRLYELARTMRIRGRLGALGSGVRLAPPIWTHGERSIAIGDGVNIWHHARIIALNAEPGITRIEIGAKAAIHPYAHIAAIRSVRIGPGALFASNVYISDHDHDWRDPEDPPITNGRVLAAPVEIGPNVWLGERVCVLRGVVIGEGAIVGAGSIVTKSLPARCIAVGAPARVIRVWNEERRAWLPVTSSSEREA